MKVSSSILLFLFFRVVSIGQIAPGTYKLRLSAWDYQAQLNLNKDSSIYYKISQNGSNDQSPYFGNWYTVNDTLFIVCKLNVVDDGVDMTLSYDSSIAGVKLFFSNTIGSPYTQTVKLCHDCFDSSKCISKVTDKRGMIHFSELFKDERGCRNNLIFDFQDSHNEIQLGSSQPNNIFRMVVREKHSKNKTTSFIEKYIIKGTKLYSTGESTNGITPLFMKGNDFFQFAY